MTSTDKDFRFMATNDLMTELQKDSIKLDDDSERKVVKMLLKLLEDKNGEVQNLAVRWSERYFKFYYWFIFTAELYFETRPFVVDKKKPKTTIYKNNMFQDYVSELFF